jgi:hypothetical protein
MKLFLVCQKSAFEILEYDQLTGKAKLKMLSNNAIVTDTIDIPALKKAGWKLVKEIDDGQLAKLRARYQAGD